ncbi:MAG TPA: SIMPL domain-containing protein [Vicinamibacterales bacterium]|nr:SIMPL domain-containing protein [Vicinamibacterales bacterium]
MRTVILAAAILGLSNSVSAQDVAAISAPSTPVIVTTGEASLQRAPDRAWVTIAAESRARTPEEAQRANTTAMSAVNGKLKASGIAADAIQTIGYNLQPEYDYANGKQTLRDYLARNEVQVRVDALDRVGEVIAAAVGSGATNVSGIRFDLKDRAGAEREAMTRAVADGVARAQAAAAGAHVTVDRVLRVEEQRDFNPPQPRPIAMMAGQAAGAAAPVPIEAGQIEIRARVVVTVAIK